MLPLSVARAAARIPWIRRNLSGFRFLSSSFRLLLALYRCGRFEEFQQVLVLFLEMASSFAQYGRAAAAQTIDGLLGIAWFAERRPELLRLVRAFSRSVEVAGLRDAPGGLVDPARLMACPDVDVFVQALKAVLGFDLEDEARVRVLLEEPGMLEDALEEFVAAAR